MTDLKQRVDELSIEEELAGDAVYYASEFLGRHPKAKPKYRVSFRGWRGLTGNCGTLCEVRNMEIAEEIAAALNARAKYEALTAENEALRKERDALRGKLGDEALYDKWVGLIKEAEEIRTTRGDAIGAGYYNKLDEAADARLNWEDSIMYPGDSMPPPLPTPPAQEQGASDE